MYIDNINDKVCDIGFFLCGYNVALSACKTFCAFLVCKEVTALTLALVKEVLACLQYLLCNNVVPCIYIILSFRRDVGQAVQSQWIAELLAHPNCAVMMTAK